MNKNRVEWNQAKIGETLKEYKERNKDRDAINERQRQYRAQNPTKFTQYEEIRRARERKVRAEEKSRGAVVPKHLFQEFLEALKLNVQDYWILSTHKRMAVVAIPTLDAAATVQDLQAKVGEVVALCPNEAARYDDGNEINPGATAKEHPATRELRRNLKRFEFDDRKGVVYFPHVLTAGHPMDAE